MRLNEIAAEIHKRMCEDDRFGYSWEERYGAFWETWTTGGKDYRIRVGDYDCSSSTITAWSVALQGTPWEGALDAAVTTHNMRSVFVGSGLFEWRGMDFLAEAGDLYLSEANHVAMCQTQYPDVLSEFSWGDNGAYGNKRGDQTGILPKRVSRHHSGVMQPEVHSMSKSLFWNSGGSASKSALIASSMALFVASMSSQIFAFSSRVKDWGELRQTSARKKASSLSSQSWFTWL